MARSDLATFYMRLFLVALQFLTRLPIRLKKEADPKELGKSLAYFPLVGLFLGICLVVLEYSLSYFFPTSIVRLVLIAFLIFITGGLHIDGLADTIDAIASGEKGDDALKIMRESTVGPIGATCVFISILAKYIALGEFVGGRLYAMLLLFPMAGRMGMSTVCLLFPYARKEGTGKAFVSKGTTKEFIISGTISFIAGIILFRTRALFILGSIILIVMLTGKYFTKKFGGITGDIVGSINEIGELVALLGGTMVI